MAPSAHEQGVPIDECQPTRCCGFTRDRLEAKPSSEASRVHHGSTHPGWRVLDGVHRPRAAEEGEEIFKSTASRVHNGSIRPGRWPGGMPRTRGRGGIRSGGRHNAGRCVLGSRRDGRRGQTAAARLHGLEGIRPHQHRHRGDCLCTLGHTDAGWKPPGAAPYSRVLAWKRVEPNRDWLKAGSKEPAREGGKNRAEPRRTWLTFGLQFSGESISSGNSILMLSNHRLAYNHG